MLANVGLFLVFRGLAGTRLGTVGHIPAVGTQGRFPKARLQNRLRIRLAPARLARAAPQIVREHFWAQSGTIQGGADMAVDPGSSLLTACIRF